MGDVTSDSPVTDTSFDREYTAPIVADSWYHLVMVMDRGNSILRAYVNGTEVTDSRGGATIGEGMIESPHYPLVIFNCGNPLKRKAEA